MPWEATFGDAPAGGFLIYEDSYGRLCIAQSQGNAAESLSALEGTTINVRRGSQPRLEAG
jgi:S-adenosylmethionine hydrolase